MLKKHLKYLIKGTGKATTGHIRKTVLFTSFETKVKPIFLSIALGAMLFVGSEKRKVNNR